MEASDIIYYRVKTFPSHSVYSRKHMTVNIRQKSSKDADALELWAIIEGSVRPTDERLAACRTQDAVMVFHRVTDLEDVPLQISPDGHIIGCCLGHIVQMLSPEEAAVWQPEELELLVPSPIPDKGVQTALQRCVETILTQARSRDPLRHEKNRAQFSRIMMLLTDCALSSAAKEINQAGAKKRQICEAAKRYMQVHVKDRIRAEDVARHLQVSYSSLSRIFAAGEGMTLVEYMNREKVLLASRLMTEQSMPLAKAAQELSISDPSYLSRMFRRYTGKTATELVHRGKK